MCIDFFYQCLGIRSGLFSAVFAPTLITSTSVLMVVTVAAVSLGRLSNWSMRTSIADCLCLLCGSSSTLVEPEVPLRMVYVWLLRYFRVPLPMSGVVSSDSVGSNLPFVDFNDCIWGPILRVRFAPGISCMKYLSSCVELFWRRWPGLFQTALIILFRWLMFPLSCL